MDVITDCDEKSKKNTNITLFFAKNLQMSQICINFAAGMMA